MEKKHKANPSTDYIQKLEEWQDRQYDPGYYTGGRILPSLTHAGRPKLLGWFFVIVSVILFVTMTFVLVYNFGEKDVLSISAMVIISYGFILLQLIGGLRLVKKGSTPGTLKKIKNKTLKMVTCFFAIVMFGISINEVMLEKESSIKIDDVKLIKLKQEYNKNYIILNNGELVLNCDSSDYFDIWAVKVTDDKGSFEIKYEWNVLSSNKGRIIELQKVD